MILIVAIVLSIVYRDKISEVLQSFTDWIRKHKALGPIVLLLVYIVTTIAFIPGSILTLGAGWAFQQAYNSTWLAILVGSASVWIGAEIGSCIAFLLGKFVLRDLSERLA